MSAFDPRMRLSVSQLKSVAQCGRSFFLSRIEKVPQVQYAWNLRGSAAHLAIEYWELNGRDIDIEDYYVNQAWPGEYQKILERHPDAPWGTTPRVKAVAGTKNGVGRMTAVEHDLQLRKEDGLKQIQNYVTRALAEQDDWRVEHSEVPFTLDWGPETPFTVVGYIDQVLLWSDGDRTLRDLKTSSNDDHESNIQLGVYKFGLKAALGIDVQYGDLWYCKLDRPSKPMDLSVYTDEYIKGEFQKLYEIKTQGLYLANPSLKNCFSCPVSKHCIESKNTNE